MKVSASMTESVQQQQNITETRNEEFPKRSRIAAGAERDVKEGIKPVVQLEEISNETKNSAVSSYVNHPSEVFSCVTDLIVRPDRQKRSLNHSFLSGALPCDW